MDGILSKRFKKLSIVTAGLSLVWAGAYYALVLPVTRLWVKPMVNPPGDNAERVKKLFHAKRVAFVGAHPDDIEWNAGATVHLMSAKGIKVRLILATRGDKGLPLIGWLREKAQINSSNILGADTMFLDFKDRQLGANRNNMSAKIEHAIKKFDPDIVICWDPSFITNPHPDHRALADVVSRIHGRWRRIYYGTRNPTVWVPYSNDIHIAKLAALAAHRTEFPPLVWQRARTYQTKLSEAYGRQVNTSYAEVLREE